MRYYCYPSDPAAHPEGLTPCQASQHMSLHTTRSRSSLKLTARGVITEPPRQKTMRGLMAAHSTRQAPVIETPTESNPAFSACRSSVLWFRDIGTWELLSGAGLVGGLSWGSFFGDV